jgi:hypothetical protein
MALPSASTMEEMTAMTGERPSFKAARCLGWAYSSIKNGYDS